MKKIVGFLAFLLAVTPLLVAAPQKASAGENLILNPSVEIATGETPQSWYHGSVWGNLDVSFSYEDNGIDGNRSVKVTASNYVSGDAKWYFEPVTIQPSQTYRYNDYYKSDVGTELVAEIVTNVGQTTYQWLAWTGPSPEWKQASAEFTTPANATTITILHLLIGNGYLQTDSFDLAQKESQEWGITNPGLEVVDPSNSTKPLAWSTSKWGSNNPTFSYLSSGYQSNRSVKVTMKRYQSGDAKWWPELIDITPGETYVFSNNYRSSVSTRVVAWIVSNDGSNSYIGLGSAPANTNWALFSDSFTAPQGAKKVSIFHIIESNGYLIVDNYRLAVGQTEGFNRPIVTLTFDDSWEDNVNTALPMMSQHSFVSTQYYATGFIDSQNSEHLAAIGQFIAAGHEIGSHSVTHPDLTTLTSQQLDTEVRTSKEFLENTFGVDVKNFASPYGAYNEIVIQKLQQYYGSHRPVDVGYNSQDNFDLWRFKVQNMTPTVTNSEFQSWLDHTKSKKLWLIIVYHRISDNDTGPYDANVNQFSDQLAAIAASGITVSTVQGAIDELTTQL